MNQMHKKLGGFLLIPDTLVASCNLFLSTIIKPKIDVMSDY